VGGHEGASAGRPREGADEVEPPLGLLDQLHQSQLAAGVGHAGERRRDQRQHWGHHLLLGDERGCGRAVAAATSAAGCGLSDVVGGGGEERGVEALQHGEAGDGLLNAANALFDVLHRVFDRIFFALFVVVIFVFVLLRFFFVLGRCRLCGFVYEQKQATQGVVGQQQVLVLRLLSLAVKSER
jgi:hypothetical protein